MNELQKPPEKLNPELISNLVLNGDISQMSPEMKVQYYNQLCHSLGLNPVTKPFQIITFQGKTILYATKDCTEQLRKINKVSIVELTQDISNGLCIAKCKVQDKDNRFDIATGAVAIANLKGGELANAIMKSETKAKRRATLSICGLGILDESELDTMPEYKTADITQVTTADFSANPFKEMSEAKDLETLKKVWTSNKPLQHDKIFQELKEKRKAELTEVVKVEDLIPAELTRPDSELKDLSRMNTFKTISGLDGYYQHYISQDIWNQYDENYKTEFSEYYTEIRNNLSKLNQTKTNGKQKK
jgi:hypothetical protein